MSAPSQTKTDVQTWLSTWGGYIMAALGAFRVQKGASLGLRGSALRDKRAGHPSKGRKRARDREPERLSLFQTGELPPNPLTLG